MQSMRHNFQHQTLRPKFVGFIPGEIEVGILYVSMELATAVHKCPCGCDADVFTPLAPSEWQLFYDGLSVTLKPSIGSWSLPCRSHYWITKNRVIYAGSWEEYIRSSEKGKRKQKRKKWFSFDKDK